MRRTRTIPRTVGSLLLGAFLCVGLNSCDVHELPVDENGNPVDVVQGAGLSIEVSLAFNYDLPQYILLGYDMKDYMSKARDDEYPDGIYPYRARYTVNLYPFTGEDEVSKTPEKTFTYIGAFVVNLQQTFTIPADPKKYRAAVFVDFVDKATRSDTFYTASDFSGISLTDAKYIGSTDFRDAFIGTADVDLSTYSSQGATAKVGVTMTRPVAKFEFVALDKDEYERRYGSTDFSKFKAVFTYNGFLPDKYDYFSNEPISSRTDVSFTSSPMVQEDGSVLLGFDYVLIGGRETSVDISMTLINDKDVTLGAARVVTPVLSDKKTTVQGDFFTGITTGGIGIDPGFDGEYNIHF